MNEQVTISTEELGALRHRVATVARANAWLRVLTSMLTRLSASSGLLDDVVSTILSVLMETIGGSNLIVYYSVGGHWHVRDVFGTAREMEALDEPLVARAVNEGAFVRAEETANREADEPRVWTWVYPLAVGQRVIGAVAMRGMHFTDEAVERELQPFFVYAALMLGNEISNYSELERAHHRLLAAHRTLERETEARLAAEEHYRILFEQSPFGVVLIDPATRRPVRFNRAAHEQLGYTADEFAGLTLLDIDARDTEDEIARRTQRFLAEGSQAFETVHRGKNGLLRQVIVTGKVLDLGHRQMILAIVQDVTDAKKMEGELLRAQKLESIGVLAGGIAHDFNNFLMAILGNVALAGQALGPASPARALLSECEEACTRARELTQQLLTFAKGGAPVKVTMPVGVLVRESALFASRGSGARCVFRIPDELWWAQLDRGQISQVVHNLVINAVQAMPSGGTIEIRGENVPGSGGGPDLVRIDIEDHGVGIPPEQLPKIFDPYFTTKPGGSGLGLASAYSVVRRHGGRIEVDSTPGRGSRFSVLLPATRDVPQADTAPARSPAARHRKVLVMDDDRMVARVVSRMLAQLECDVDCSRDGTEVVAKYREAMAAGRPFDLVILDLTIPGGMGGRETLLALRELDPGVTAIVSSGYSSDATVADCEAFGFAGALRKPYNLDEIGRVLAGLRM